MSFENCFREKKVLITGAGRGIGRALVERLYNYGSTVYCLSKSPDNLEKLQKEFPNVKTICVDLEDWKETKLELEKLPCIDLLVNNAACSILQKFLDITSETFDKHVNINLKSVINVSQVIVKKMIESKVEGSIVNVSSLTSKRVWPMAGVYGLSKAGLDHLTQTMANELGQFNIRVNCINSGLVQTDMALQGIKAVQDGGIDNTSYRNRYPMNKYFIEMDQVVNTVLFLLSDMAPMVHGSGILIDGGYCVT